MYIKNQYNREYSIVKISISIVSYSFIQLFKIYFNSVQLLLLVLVTVLLISINKSMSYKDSI